MRMETEDGGGEYLLHSAQERAALRRRCFGDMEAGEEISRAGWREDMVDGGKGHGLAGQRRAGWLNELRRVTRIQLQ